MVLPYFSGGDLFQKVKARRGKGLPERQARLVASDLVQGLLYMKGFGVAHRWVASSSQGSLVCQHTLT